MKRDLINNLKIEKSVSANVKTASDKTTFTGSVDTKDKKSLAFLGVLINSNDDSIYEPTSYDDVKLILQESSDDAVFTDVDPEEKQLGDKSLKIGKSYPKIGAFSTKRYVRLKVVGENLETLGNEELVADFIVVGEEYIRPVE